MILTTILKALSKLRIFEKKGEGMVGPRPKSDLGEQRVCTEKRALLSILLLFIINVIIVIILIIGAFVYTISYLRLRCIPLIHRLHGRKLRVALHLARQHARKS